MPQYKKTVVLPDHAHVIHADFDGFAVDPLETYGGWVVGIAELVPREAIEQRGHWRITVEFEPLGGGKWN